MPWFTFLSTGVETGGIKYRIVVGFSYQVTFSIGGGLLGLVAYLIRDWRTLQMCVSIPMITMVAITWYQSHFLTQLEWITWLKSCIINWVWIRYLPESTRWLITKKRYVEARALILEAARVNNKHVPEHLLIVPNDSGEEEQVLLSIRYMSPWWCVKIFNRSNSAMVNWVARFLWLAKRG